MMFYIRNRAAIDCVMVLLVTAGAFAINEYWGDKVAFGFFMIVLPFYGAIIPALIVCPRCGIRPFRPWSTQWIICRNCGFNLRKNRSHGSDGAINFDSEEDLRISGKCLGSLETYDNNELEKRVYKSTIFKMLPTGIIAGICFGFLFFEIWYVKLSEKDPSWFEIGIIASVIVFFAVGYLMALYGKRSVTVIIDDQGIRSRNLRISIRDRYFKWDDIIETEYFSIFGILTGVEIKNKRGEMISISFQLKNTNSLIDDVVRCAGEDHVLSQELLKYRKPKK